MSRMNLITEISRRAFLGHSAGGLGGLALAHLLANPANAAEIAAKPKARAVICLFQHGGPSQMDLFDPKPLLTKHDGKKFPGAVSYTHLRAHETPEHLVCRLLLEK